MTIERLKQVKNVISDVYQGFAGCSTGGCCGVSLPKEDQDKLKQWKQDLQQKSNREGQSPYDRVGYLSYGLFSV